MAVYHQAAHKYLQRARAAGHLATTHWHRERHLKEGDGSEHYIELRGRRVFKHTRNRQFGLMMHLNREGRLDLRPARATEYVERMRAHNTLFGTDFRLEGSHALDGGGLTYSQTHFGGGFPPQPEVTKYTEGRGFRKVQTQEFGDTSTKHSTWFHPETGYLVTDARWDNFRLDFRGTLHPIDLIIKRVTKGTALHRVLLKGIAPEHA